MLLSKIIVIVSLHPSFPAKLYFCRQVQETMFCHSPSLFPYLSGTFPSLHSWFLIYQYQGHFKSRNEEIRNGNEEMGNEKK